MTKPADDRAFIERHMVHGHASRQPLRRALRWLGPGLMLLVGGVGYASGWLPWDGSDALLAEVPLPGGSLLVFEHLAFGLAMGAGGLVLLWIGAQTVRRDRALARRGQRRPGR